MIILLHGDNTEASRAELNRIRSTAANKEIRELDGRTADAVHLTQALESHSLFGGDTLVIIENLFGKLGRKTKIIEELAEIILRSATSCDIVLWENKEIGVTVSKSLGPKIQNKLYKIPVIIFQFLDSLHPGNSKNSLELYEKLKSGDAPELIFSMMVRRVRQLMEICDKVLPPGVQPWQLSRLTSQAKLFSIKELIAQYQNLLTIEYSIKSGSSAFTISEHIEQWLINL